jgi:hypothetical protein
VTANAVGHHEQAEPVVAVERVFIELTFTADIGQGVGSKAKRHRLSVSPVSA